MTWPFNRGPACGRGLGSALCATTLLALALIGPAAAQTADGTAELPALVITSEPPGAVVTLRGPYQWVGQTPWQLFREVSGRYQVEAQLPGYEPYRGEVVLGAGGVRQFNIKLSKRTRVKAGMRSLLVPGWGQFYYGSRPKGVLMVLAATGAVAALVWSDVRYQDKLDVFNDRKHAYESSTHLEEFPALRARAQAASDDADEAYNRRQTFLGVTAGVWALSFLDAIFFFPRSEALPQTFNESAARTSGPDWLVEVDPRGLARAGLTYRFK